MIKFHYGALYHAESGTYLSNNVRKQRLSILSLYAKTLMQAFQGRSIKTYVLGLKTESKKKTDFKKIMMRKVSLLGIIVAVLLILGLTGPWFSQFRGGNSADLVMRVSLLNPLHISYYTGEKIVADVWFYSLGTSISAGGFVLAAILSAFSFGRWRISLAGLLIWIVSLEIFFLSFGSGLGLGFSTEINWGLHLTLACGIIFFVLVLVNRFND